VAINFKTLAHKIESAMFLEIQDFSKEQIKSIFNRVDSHGVVEKKLPIACSFEGKGVRTKSSFYQAIHCIGLDHIELPMLLDTDERLQDVAGYLDEIYSAYVIRYSNHKRLCEFAKSSKRPVINAMSNEEHPCEAMADVFWFESFKSVNDSCALIWGPITNVLRSWAALFQYLGGNVIHFRPNQSESSNRVVERRDFPNLEIDIVVTDGWPKDCSDITCTLTLEDLKLLGNPKVLPTPPFTIGKELGFDPILYSEFCGYEQKRSLVPVQAAILH
jgi:ornithine carbamoyltransferase